MRSVFLVLSALSYPLYGQTFDWVRLDPVNLSTNPLLLVNTLTADSSGHVTRARLIRSKLLYGSAYFGDQILEKWDAAGERIWTDTLFGKVFVAGLTTDRNECLWVYGLFRDTVQIDTAIRIIPLNSTPECFLLNLNPSGSVAWLMNMKEVDPGLAGIRDMAVDQENHLWAAVETNGLSTFIKKFDGSGQVIGSIEQTSVRVISGISVDDGMNVWAAGSTFGGSASFNGLNVTAPFNYNMYVVKYRPDGSAAWVRFVEDITLSSPRIAADRSDGAIMSGRLLDSTNFGGFPAHGPQWVYDLFVTKIDSGGDFAWLSEVPLENNGADASVGEGLFLAVPDDTTIYVAGFSRNAVNWGGGIVSTPFGSYDVLLLNYASDGTARWVLNAGSSSTDRADAVFVDRFGNCFLSGHVGSDSHFGDSTLSGASDNIFLARITPAAISGAIGQPWKAPFLLYPNYPNPFNPSTGIRYRLSEAANVSVKMYNLLGQEVRTLIREYQTQGEHTVVWDGTDHRGRQVATGVYIYRVQAGGHVQSRKMLLLR